MLHRIQCPLFWSRSEEDPASREKPELVENDPTATFGGCSPIPHTERAAAVARSDRCCGL